LGELRKEAEHRRELEKNKEASDRTLALMPLLIQAGGVASALIISLAGFWTAYQIANLGFPGWATAVAALDIGGLATVFITGTRRRRKKNETEDEGSNE
jgi:hypothetical protein